MIDSRKSNNDYKNGAQDVRLWDQCGTARSKRTHLVVFEFMWDILYQTCLTELVLKSGLEEVPVFQEVMTQGLENFPFYPQSPKEIEKQNESIHH
jgi:hypothetical protein